MALSHRVTELLEKWLGTKTIVPKIQISDGTNDADVIKCDGCYGLVTMTPGHISTDNSFDGTLSSGESFIGTAEEIVNFGVISVIVSASMDTVTDGFKIEFSTDGTNWIDGDNYTIYAGAEKVFSFQCSARYYRILITNDIVGSNDIILQTILKPYYVKPSSHRIGDLISPEDDAELMKSVLTAQKDDGIFTPITASPSKNLRVTMAEDGLSIAKGDVSDTTYIHKFGNAPDFDTSDNEVTVWDGANDASINQMTYVFSTTAAINTISSSNATDTQTIRLQGLDANWELTEQNVTLNGQNKVTLTTPLIRMFRGRNTSSTNLLGRVFVYEDTPIVAGVPTDTTKIRMEINDGNNQTLMAIYTVPDGYTGYLRDWYASTAGASKDSQYIIRIKARDNLNNGVFQLKQIMSISDIATSYLHHKYEEPEKFNERVDIIITAQSTATGASGCSVSAGFDIVLVKNI